MEYKIFTTFDFNFSPSKEFTQILTNMHLALTLNCYRQKYKITFSLN